MLVIDAIEYLRRSIMFTGSMREGMELVVATHIPSYIGPVPHAQVLRIDAGLDWNAGRVLICTDPGVCTVEHLNARVHELEAEIERLRAQVAMARVPGKAR